MGFWRRHMPPGMLLRSGVDWHLDPLGVHTLRGYLEEAGIDEADARPFPVELFIDYADWYARQAGVEAIGKTVTALRRGDGHDFAATFEDGSSLAADAVVATPGLRHFAWVPPEVRESLAPQHYSHTCTTTRFDHLQGSRVLVLGGRQSAFEWAALLAEQAGAEVEIVFRHDRPRFETSDWSFVDPMLEQTVRERGWFRRLPPSERDAIRKRFWSEGRLKLEPWLEGRINRPPIRIWPNQRVLGYAERPEGGIEARLGDGLRLVVDHVILATGYVTDMTRVPYLAAGDLLRHVELHNGAPALDEDLQASVPGLFFPSWPSTEDFGPFFGF